MDDVREMVANKTYAAILVSPNHNKSRLDALKEGIQEPSRSAHLQDIPTAPESMSIPMDSAYKIYLVYFNPVDHNVRLLNTSGASILMELIAVHNIRGAELVRNAEFRNKPRPSATNAARFHVRALSHDDLKQFLDKRRIESDGRMYSVSVAGEQRIQPPRAPKPPKKSVQDSERS